MYVSTYLFVYSLSCSETRSVLRTKKKLGHLNSNLNFHEHGSMTRFGCLTKNCWILSINTVLLRRRLASQNHKSNQACKCIRHIQNLILVPWPSAKPLLWPASSSSKNSTTLPCNSRTIFCRIWDAVSCINRAAMVLLLRESSSKAAKHLKLKSCPILQNNRLGRWTLWLHALRTCLRILSRNEKYLHARTHIHCDKFVLVNCPSSNDLIETQCPMLCQSHLLQTVSWSRRALRHGVPIEPTTANSRPS